MTSLDKITLTFKFRLRDKHAAELNRQARAVNFVWNYCNETQQKAARSGRKWLSNYDLQKLTSGSSVKLDIHAHTIQRICGQYYDSRRAHKRAWLKFRGKKSLGWVPFNTGHVSFDGQCFWFRKVRYEPMHLRDDLKPDMKLLAGAFNQDSQGHWYINVPVEVPVAPLSDKPVVGIDLGLKVFATMSDGNKIEVPRLYRASEAALATAQRAKKKPKRVRKIHANIANRRKDFLHKASAAIVNNYGFIAVGDVNSEKLAKTNMAKSVLDAGWSSFRRMLAYKSIRNGAIYVEANEQYTSQTCSCCGAVPHGRPKGIAGLGIREWVCSDCGVVHDRDVNAAKNILRVGEHTLVEGALALAEELPRHPWRLQ